VVATSTRSLLTTSLLAAGSVVTGCGLDRSGEAVNHGDAGHGVDASALTAPDGATAVVPDAPDDSPNDSAGPSPPPDAPAPPPIGFVQVAAATPQTSMGTVSVTYTEAQTAGDLDVVVVGWNDVVAQVSSVADSSGNLYERAVGPTTDAIQLSQSIYYSPNIRAATPGANVVTVTFSIAAQYADVRIVEYRGLATATPLDQTSAANGSTAAASTPAVTTTSANELILAAGITTGTFQTVAAPFVQRIITTPDGDTVEDETATSVGSYGVTVQQNGKWVMQIATFRSPP
jgi:hypothetical protein